MGTAFAPVKSDIAGNVTGISSFQLLRIVSFWFLSHFKAFNRCFTLNEVNLGSYTMAKGPHRARHPAKADRFRSER